MFYGRKNELRLLNERFDSDRFEFLPIYGRRRVGKTALIQEFIRDKPHVYYSAINGTHETNMARLSAKVFGRPGITATFDSLLEELDSRAAGGRMVLVIDEYPRFISNAPWVSDMLQNFIDERKNESKLFIILCGSSINLMEHEVLGYKSPLYGRRTGSLKLEPFDYFQSREMLEGFSEEDMVRIYGMVGGVPLYLEVFDSRRTLSENVMRNFLRSDSFFLAEPTMMLLEEFENPVTYQMVLNAIADGCTKMSEISNRIDMESSNASKLVSDLCRLGIVRKESPVDNPNGRMTRYHLEDPFLAFYYRHMYGLQDDLTPETLDETADEILTRHEDSLGFVFERICAEYFREKGQVGKWWGSDPRTRRMEEIDIVVSNRRDGIMSRTFVECKYKRTKVGADVLQTLISRSMLVKGTDERRYALCSKSGFTEGLSGNDVTLLTLDDMVRERCGSKE